ncbi:unnamed protein product [Urochloa humidicola]
MECRLLRHPSHIIQSSESDWHGDPICPPQGIDLVAGGRNKMAARRPSRTMSTSSSSSSCTTSGSSGKEQLQRHDPQAAVHEQYRLPAALSTPSRQGDGGDG